MIISKLHTRVLSIYVNALCSGRIVALKRSLAASTSWMTSVLNRCNTAVIDSADSADKAKTSENNAATSAGNALTSENNARGLEAMMEARMHALNKLWLGVSDSDPTTDLNGDPLIDGAEYFNNSAGSQHVRVYRTSDNAWHDQDETTEAEMASAKASAAASAASASAADTSNQQAQNANTAAQSAMSSVNTSMFWLNTWWLGASAGAPATDRNGNALKPGCYYFDNNAITLKVWNGSSWITLPTSLDIDFIHDNFVKTDGSNSMTGPLTINNSDYNGVVLNGSKTPDNTWFTSPSLTTTLTGPVVCRTIYRTSYNAGLQLSYGDISHGGVAGSVGCGVSLWSDGITSTSSDLHVGGRDKGTANVYCRTTNLNDGDIAEYYTSRSIIDKGTIVSISTKDDVAQELAIATDRDDVFGVISTAPGVVLNNRILTEDKTNALPVALCGRVPLRVKGKVSKGCKIYLSTIAGVGTANLEEAVSDKLIARALVSDKREEEKLVEVALINFS